MDVISYIDILRRRWILVGACVALAIVAVWVTLPQKADVSAATTSYRATATLALAAHGGDPPNLARLALYATVGEVPVQVKERLHAKESPLVLASKISTRVNPETETITISTEDPDGATAVRTANTFSEELMAYLERSERREAKAQLGRVEEHHRRLLEPVERARRGDRRRTAQVDARGGARRSRGGVPVGGHPGGRPAEARSSPAHRSRCCRRPSRCPRCPAGSPRRAAPVHGC